MTSSVPPQRSTFVRKIIPRFLEMFEARGYTNISNTIDMDASPIEISGHDPIKDEEVRLIYFDNPKFNVRTAEVCVNIAQKINHLIIIYRNDITCFARRVLNTYIGATVEHFPAKELQINITRHVLQPKKFIRLSDHMADAFRKKWGDEFPKMYRSDKIARYFNFVKGDVIEIHRKDGDVVYRLVV